MLRTLWTTFRGSGCSSKLLQVSWMDESAPLSRIPDTAWPLLRWISLLFCERQSPKLRSLSASPSSSWGSRWIQRSHLSRAKTDPCSNLCFMIDKILQSNSLSPTLAASVLGKFGFLCSTWFGKVGRCRMGALRARQDGCSDDYHLTPDIITCLRMLPEENWIERSLDTGSCPHWPTLSLADHIYCLGGSRGDCEQMAAKTILHGSAWNFGLPPSNRHLSRNIAQQANLAFCRQWFGCRRPRARLFPKGGQLCTHWGVLAASFRPEDRSLHRQSWVEIQPCRWPQPMGALMHSLNSKYFSPNSNFLYVTTVEWFVTRSHWQLKLHCQSLHLFGSFNNTRGEKAHNHALGIRASCPW